MPNNENLVDFIINVALRDLEIWTCEFLSDEKQFDSHLRAWYSKVVRIYEPDPVPEEVKKQVEVYAKSYCSTTGLWNAGDSVATTEF